MSCFVTVVTSFVMWLAGSISYQDVTVDVTRYTRIPAIEDVPQHYLNEDYSYISLESIHIFVAASYSTKRLFKATLSNGDGPQLQWCPRLSASFVTCTVAMGGWGLEKPRRGSFLPSCLGNVCRKLENYETLSLEEVSLWQLPGLC
ncbi:hypothetical protein HOLleu_07992 [Holothuria leucospilota]|uniref:Uncharacterized protein n=1 Tax=Holothuria leucospilota TaxID=206669 RepID=A0A9Q1CI10_HOLLE|nr:hypothetical protein HOLleu_07992 [Holothuria leucospilota]